MKNNASINNEQLAATAFTKQSAVFDGLYAEDAIIRYKRSRVRDHVLRYLPPQSRILELNSGTGEDAVFFAGMGHQVHATDISAGMLRVLKTKAEQQHLAANISTELCSFTQLHQLAGKGPYDLIFSNFGGLNCTGNLKEVLHSFDALLKPGGLVTLVVISKFCLWESLLLFKGKWKTAARRLFRKKGRKAHVEGTYFTCWYYTPGYIINELKGFDVLCTEGLCTIVPPSYMEGFAGKHPRLYTFLQSLENKLKEKWPWMYTGDYFIITLKKPHPSPPGLFFRQKQDGKGPG